MFAYVLAVARRLIHNDHAQDAFEYLLVIGGVSVAIIAIMVTPVGEDIVEALVNGVCSAINGIEGFDIGECNFGAGD